MRVITYMIIHVDPSNKGPLKYCTLVNKSSLTQNLVCLTAKKENSGRIAYISYLGHQLMIYIPSLDSLHIIARPVIYQGYLAIAC